MPSEDPPSSVRESRPSIHEAARDAALDGVRGIAILLVLLVHFTPDYLMPNRPLEWLKKLEFTGWIGVDLFFVLSGMLITEVLLKSKSTDHAAKQFYVRRSLRIMPLYLTTLLFCFGVLPFFVPAGVDPKFDTMRSVQGWYWVHCANVLVLLHGFDAMMSNTVNLAHFWSLAVEEHFYLLWPWVVWRCRETNVFRAALMLVLIAVAIRLACLFTISPEDAKGVFVQTPMRMDGLALGSALAIFLRRGDAARFRAAAWCVVGAAAAFLGVTFVVQKGLWSTSPVITSIGFTIIAAMFAALLLILRTDSPQSPFRRAIGNRTLVFFGKYSYGIYVLHGLMIPLLDWLLPAEEMLATLGSAVAATAIILPAKIAAATATALISWRLLELPFLNLKRFYEYGRA